MSSSHPHAPLSIYTPPFVEIYSPSGSPAAIRLFSQSEDHSPQRIGSLLRVAVSVKLFQQTGPADAPSPLLGDEMKHQQMEHLPLRLLPSSTGCPGKSC